MNRQNRTSVIFSLALLITLVFAGCDITNLQNLFDGSSEVETKPFSEDGDIRLYFDGNLLGAAETPGRLPGTVVAQSDLNFSSGYGDEIGPDQRDELLVFHRALTSTEIESLFTDPGSLPADTSSMVGYYQFDGSLDSHPLTMGPTATSSPSVAVSYMTGGVSGTGLNLSGGPGEVAFPSAILPNEFAEFTLNIWIKMNSLHQDVYISVLNCWKGSVDDDFFNIDIINGELAYEEYRSDLSSYDETKWHMITLVIENGPFVQVE